MDFLKVAEVVLFVVLTILTIKIHPEIHQPMLIEDADLIIRLVVDQLTQSVFHVCVPIDVGFNSIDNTVVGDTAFNYVIPTPWTFALSAINNKVEPFLVVCIKPFNFAVRWKCKLVDVDDGLRGFTDCHSSFCPLRCLFVQWRKVKAGTEVQVFSADTDQRAFDNVG